MRVLVISTGSQRAYWRAGGMMSSQRPAAVNTPPSMAAAFDIVAGKTKIALDPCDPNVCAKAPRPRDRRVTKHSIMDA